MKKKVFFILPLLLFTCCAVNIFGAKYYRLLEKERKIFLGLRAIDSLAAGQYIDLRSPTERDLFYQRYWEGKPAERSEFESRTEYAFREFGRAAPLTDDRIKIHVKHGSASKRQSISQKKMIALTPRETVKPAEIWTYLKDGIEFDFIRIARAYKLVAMSEFGDRVKVPHFKEDALPPGTALDSSAALDFNMSFGRFRQRKNLTRLELYLSFDVIDTAGLALARKVRIYDRQGALIIEKADLMRPADGARGIFYDEVNLWLEPKPYKVVVEIYHMKRNLMGRKSIMVDLLEYQDDAKEISDLVAALLIDEGMTDEKFNKPEGRVIPLADAGVPVSRPFYFYHEVYNLETKEGMHHLRSTYEIYNKAQMKREVADIVVNDDINEGDVAYASVKYHPMDLPAGEYVIIARDTDMISGKERTAVGEFELLAGK
jgi:hypothetical protein